MVDLKITDDGELVLSPAGDLAITYGDEQIAQEVVFRLKTTLGDWTLSPTVGASLEEFIGQPNTPLVLAAIEQRINNTLTSDNLLIFPDINAVSISENEVFILIEFGSLEDDDRIITVQSALDLRKGLVFARVGSRDLQ